MTTISRAESDLMRRSMGSQVEYWARIGRAVERTGQFSHEKIKDALLSRLEIDALNEWEKPVFDEEHDIAMRSPSAREERAHTERLSDMNKADIDTGALGD